MREVAGNVFRKSNEFRKSSERSSERLIGSRGKNSWGWVGGNRRCVGDKIHANDRKEEKNQGDEVVSDVCGACGKPGNCRRAPLGARRVDTVCCVEGQRKKGTISFCDKITGSQQADPIWQPAWPRWMRRHSRI